MSYAQVSDCLPTPVRHCFLPSACYNNDMEADWYKEIPKDDAGNKYELIKPVAVTLHCEVPTAIGKMQGTDTVVFLAKDHTIQVLPPYKWDGATYAPDFESVLLPSLIHDILYDAIKSGYTMDFDLADAIFMSLMKATDFELKDIYYSAVHRFSHLCRLDTSTATLDIENIKEEGKSCESQQSRSGLQSCLRAVRKIRRLIGNLPKSKLAIRYLLSKM